MTDVKQTAIALVAEIDPDELALRLLCIGIGATPPVGDARSAREIVDEAMSMWPNEIEPFPFDIMAREAIKFMAECIGKGARPS